LDEEEVSSSVLALGEAPDVIKLKLQEILQLLNQDIGSLVQDAEGIRRAFRLLKGQLPTNVESALLPAAFIEGRQFRVLQAKQRLSSRANQAKLIVQREASRSRANDIKIRAEVLENSRPIIVNEIDRLKSRRAAFMKELGEFTHALCHTRFIRT
jgi:hypothetical protein